MPHGIIGRKQGMSRVFQEDGTVVPVTLIKCDDNTVDRIKTQEKDGYNVYVLGSALRKAERKTKKYYELKEFPFIEGQEELKKGQTVSVDDFVNVDTVKIRGVSKGKGFQGVIKRHGFSRGPETHGSHHHRAPGSIGACVWPGRVFKGKKLPGRMGVGTITIKDIPVVQVFSKEKVIALKGAIPGARNSFVHIYVEKVKS